MSLAMSKIPWATCCLPRSGVVNLGNGCAEESCVREMEPGWHTALLRSALDTEDDLKTLSAGL